MDVVYLTGEQLQLGCLSYGKADQRSASFFLKQAFRLENGKIAVALPDDEEPFFPSGDEHVGGEKQAGLYYASDFAPQKTRADILLNATAYPPVGPSVSSLDVRLQCGTLTKSLRVFGQRHWEPTLVADKASAPEPLTQVPITYDSAYGGPHCKDNPLGKGHGPDAEFLPQVEFPSESTRSRRDNIQPAGFGPLDPSWPQRHSLVGTYDEKWLQEEWPWYPTDFDFGFFNAAPRDQQVEGYLRGDEVLEFENLHPEHALYCSQLPGLAARCFLYERSDHGQSMFREVSLVLDTLWIDLNLERIVLVWRGSTPVRSFHLKEIERIIIATEPFVDKKTAEHYHQSMHAQLAAEEAEFDIEIEDDAEERAKFEREMEKTEAEFAQMDQEFQALDAEANTEHSQMREQFLAMGVDQGVFQRTPEEVNAVPLQVDPIEEVRRVNPQQADEFAALRVEAPQVEESAKQFDEEFAATEAEFADDPPWTRQRVLECHEAGEPIGDADLDKVDLSELSLPGVDLTGASMREAVLKNVDFSAANLSDVDFTDADLSGANLTGAILDDADFSNAVLDGTVLTDISIDGADFSGLDLKNQDFSRARGKYTEFSDADLSGVNFSGAVFDGVAFDKTNLEQANFRQAVLKECDFDSAKVIGAVFEGADLTNLRCDGADFTGANLRAVSAVGSVWEKSILDQADLSRGVFKNSEFSQVSARETIFDRADCTECNFEDAQLEATQLTNCNLLRASFARAEMQRANLAGSNCYEADFFEALLEDSNLSSTNLKKTLIAGRRHG